MPISRESFGRVAVESGILKIPVLAANEGGFKETIVNNYNGFLIDDNSSEKYRDKILELLYKPEIIEKIKVNSYNYAKNNFNINIHFKKIIKIYQKLK